MSTWLAGIAFSFRTGLTALAPVSTPSTIGFITVQVGTLTIALCKAVVTGALGPYGADVQAGDKN